MEVDGSDQFPFVSWVMAVGSSRSSSRVYDWMSNVRDLFFAKKKLRSLQVQLRPLRLLSSTQRVDPPAQKKTGEPWIHGVVFVGSIHVNPAGMSCWHLENG